MEANPYSKKVVMVGDQSVGKTSIIQRLIENRFNSNTSPTVGSSNHVYNVTTTNGKRLTLNIWDTAGQEQYHSLSQIYFRDSAAAIVVIDGTKPDSVAQVVKWMDKFHEVVPNGFVGVAVNKSDLLPDLAEGKTQCLDIESEIGTSVTLVSAKTGEGVSGLFKNVADNIIDTIPPGSEIKVNAGQNYNNGCSC